MIDQLHGRRRVVVTGLGALTPVGNNVPDTWAALVAGRSGIAPVSVFDATPYASSIGGEVKGFAPQAHFPPKAARRMARCSQLAVVAAAEAVADAGLDWEVEDRERAGVIVGTGLGGLELLIPPIGILEAEGFLRVVPHIGIEALANMPAFHVGLESGCLGPMSTVVTACASGTQAIGQAANLIRHGGADVVLAGGTEAQINALFFAGFTSMRALSTRNDAPTQASRPFDAERDGFVIAEGAAMVVLEEHAHALARGARIYAELLGQSASADAYHAAQPDPTGQGPARAMRWALADARLQPEEVGYINAHGTSTPLNDATETAAIKLVFGEHAYQLAISSTKSMIGHCIGGAGAIEAVATVMTVYTDTIHPTINYENPDPACDLDYVPNSARRQRVNAALSNSFGLGGQNACLIVGKYASQ